MPRSAWMIAITVLALCAVRIVLADTACLLSASAPGAYAARYWPDRLVLTYDVKKPVTVRAHLPQAAKWAQLDGTALPGGKMRWDAAACCAVLQLPAGAHTIQVGWAGQYRRPQQGQKIPIMLRGKRVGSLTCRFELGRMTAEGVVSAPLGTYAVAVKPQPGAALADLTLTIGNTPVCQKGRMSAGHPFVIGAATPVSAVSTTYNLTSCPIREIVLQTQATALSPKRLPAMPEGGLVIEAEDYVDEGLGKVEVSTRHLGTHGGKSIFQNSGDGHWLEYRFTLPQAGAYDLYARAATTEPFDLRSLTIDGASPPGIRLIQFPGTGGWGYSAQEWAAWQLTGIRGAPSLQLTAGEHRLRITGEGRTHLNLDYFVLLRR